MTTLASLGAQDRAHVEAMLARYGLGGETYMRGRLVVAEATVLELRHDTPLGGTHITLTTYDLDQAKRWIGTPDSVFDDEPFGLEPPSHAFASPKQLANLTQEEATALQEAARHYLYGDSRQVRAYKESLETMFAPFEVKTYIYTTLEVSGVLTFKDPAALVLANTILFRPGGRIESTGNLSIQATYIVTAS